MRGADGQFALGTREVKIGRAVRLRPEQGLEDSAGISHRSCLKVSMLGREKS